jgi:hypothetical protein
MTRFPFGFIPVVLDLKVWTSLKAPLLLSRKTRPHSYIFPLKWQWSRKAAGAYVVTFAFVTFRLLNDYYPGARLQPDGDRAITFGWASWALPLLFTEIILQLRRMHSSTVRG